MKHSKRRALGMAIPVAAFLGILASMLYHYEYVDWVVVGPIMGGGVVAAVATLAYRRRQKPLGVAASEAAQFGIKQCRWAACLLALNCKRNVRREARTHL